jgi:hypothetical protein
VEAGGTGLTPGWCARGSSLCELAERGRAVSDGSGGRDGSRQPCGQQIRELFSRRVAASGSSGAPQSQASIPTVWGGMPATHRLQGTTASIYSHAKRRTRERWGRRVVRGGRIDCPHSSAPRGDGWRLTGREDASTRLLRRPAIEVGITSSKYPPSSSTWCGVTVGVPRIFLADASFSAAIRLLMRIGLLT